MISGSDFKPFQLVLVGGREGENRSFSMHSPVSSNLPVSTLSVHLSRLRVGQYFAICRSVLVRQYGSDNVGATSYYINRTVVKIFWEFNYKLSITPLDNSDN